MEWLSWFFACRYASKLATTWNYDFAGDGQTFQKFPIIGLYNISKKKLEMKLIFCIQTNIRVSYRLISILWASKFLTRWYSHFWWAWSNILKVLKVTSFQYLCNTSKQMLEMEFIFCMQIHIKVSTIWH